MKKLALSALTAAALTLFTASESQAADKFRVGFGNGHVRGGVSLGHGSVRVGFGHNRGHRAVNRGHRYQRSHRYNRGHSHRGRSSHVQRGHTCSHRWSAHYRQVWVAPVYRQVVVGCDRYGNSIYRRVCVRNGYYRKVRSGYRCGSCGTYR